MRPTLEERGYLFVDGHGNMDSFVVTPSGIHIFYHQIESKLKKLIFGNLEQIELLHCLTLFHEKGIYMDQDSLYILNRN